MFNKKAIFDIAIYAIPSFFLLILILIGFSLYFATISKDLPTIETTKIEEDTISLINLLKTSINEKETFADLVRNSVEKNDFDELDQKIKELFQNADVRYYLSIYEDDALLYEIGKEPTSTTELPLPIKDNLITIKFYLK